MTFLNQISRQAVRLVAALVLAALFSIGAAAQSVDRTQLLNEIMALQAQLRNTADPVQVALLEGQLKAKELTFLQPDQTDLTANAAFLAQPDTGLIRIMPREKFDGALLTRGGGSYYSFVRLVHEYGFGSDLGLEQKNFRVGFAGADFGFMVSLGSTDLNSVTLDHPAVKYLAIFATPLSEPEARVQQQRANMGFMENGFSYRNRIAANLNETYAVRSVDYGDSDILVALRFVREDSDGSQILQWKLLRWFSTPQLDGNSIASTSAANYKRGVFARNSIVALFGSNLSSRTEIATTLPLPTTLAGVSVSFNPANRSGRSLPLFSVTPEQVNFLIPSDMPYGWGFLTVTRSNRISSSELIRIAPTSPGLFTANSDGKGVPAAVALRFEQDGSQRYSAISRFDGTRHVPVPIDLGEQPPGSVWPKNFILLYGTGISNITDPSKLKVTVGGVTLPVYGAAAVPGYAGLDQVNVELLQVVAGRGEVDLVLTVDGQVANTVRINIK